MGPTGATKKLYLEDPYTVSFQAELLSCETLADGRIAAVLDHTCFYPESGGQLADGGTIEDIEVVDVWEDDSEIVYHELAKELSTGLVTGLADWERRFNHMQHHTGQHVLSRAFIEIAGLQTVSFHMGAGACTIDLDGGELTDDIVQQSEVLANTVVWQDREVTVRTVSPSDLKDTALRKKLPDGVTTVRLVEIEDFDVIGCCGTHVRRTGELGLIKVLKYEKAKGTHRVSFKVGRRAFDDFRHKHDIVRSLSMRFTTSIDGLDDKIQKLQSEGQSHRKTVQHLSKRLAEFEAEALVKSALDHAGTKIIGQVFSDCDDAFLRALATALKSEPRTISLVGSDSGTIICNASGDLQIDFSESIVERAKSLGGSGGGKVGFATVRLPEGVSVEGFLKEAVEEIKST